MAFEIPGKVALVTGGAQGIGFSIAKELLKNGAKGVALLDVDEVIGKKAAEGLAKEFSKSSAIFLKTDVREKSQFEAAFERTIQTYGHLDIVVNNAGIFDESKWEECIAINLQGCVIGSLLALDKYFPGCLKKGGIILNVASVAGLMAVPSAAVYTGTKAGVIGFSRSISRPERSHNVEVKILTICPGATTTSLYQKSKAGMSQEQIDKVEKIMNYKQQTPEELAGQAIAIINEGKTGSIWVIDNNERIEIEFPELYNPAS